ncbi:predicted protein [Naegleria gruberi]|uniref:Predicted protein n=1 Tax=Naegleria gruberi TaxID=5762 RepID=D2V3I6_NAEGR|nr:uncharacterized protein NAEGRDRAFT_78413 [Naegleria gruberi]EFC48779.1 predicted protein [Naegleria gruberi]|eukprot:XP_002681523.1 predicted protein [Naegleria gruberi strain NEG-M]
MNHNKSFNSSSHTRKNHHQSNNQSSSSNNYTSRTIHIGNISSYTTVESLQLLFSKYGQVTNIKLAGDPSYAKRFAFVEFVDHHQAKLSLSLDGTEFMGQNLKISMAKHDFNSKQNSASTNNNNNNGNNGNLTPLIEKPVVFPPLITPQNNNKKKTDPIRKKKVESPETSTLPPNYLPPSPSSLYLGGLSPISNSSIVDANSAASRTIHISGIDSSFSEDELLDYFSVYGDITNYRLCNNDQQSSNSNTQLQTKFAFIEYATTEQSLKAIMVNGSLWGKSKLKVSHSKTAIQTPPKKSLIDKQYRDLVERTIHVGGIDVKLSQDHVKAFFEELCGAIHRIAMAGDTESYETRFCFIEFEDKQSTLRALRLSGCTIAGSVKQIKVSPSKSPIGYSKNNTTISTTPSTQST